jgi:hypothetical protein
MLLADLLIPVNKMNFLLKILTYLNITFVAEPYLAKRLTFA